MSAFRTRLAGTPRTAFRGAVVAAVVALAWGLTGCTSASSDSSGGVDYGAPGPGEQASDDRGGGTAADVSKDDRSVIITGSMYMTVVDPIRAADEATRLVSVAGGRVDARRETAATEYDGGSASLTVRIPEGDLEAVVDDLRTLGTVDEYSTDATDVTREVTDLEARISTLRASTARIEALLTDAKDISDIITLENELDRRQTELESLEAQQRGLDDQVSMSTIDLSLTTEPVVVVDDAPRTFVGGLESGWNGLKGFVAGTLVVAGVLLPWLVAAAVVGALALAVFRSIRSRKTRHTPVMSESPTPGQGD